MDAIASSSSICAFSFINFADICAYLALVLLALYFAMTLPNERMSPSSLLSDYLLALVLHMKVCLRLCMVAQSLHFHLFQNWNNFVRNHVW